VAREVNDRAESQQPQEDTTMPVEIMDTTKLCRYFPPIPQPEIIRESFLDTIKRLFTDYSVVVVEGEEGIGKTTLLAQFARENPECAISVFIKPITRSSYDPDQIRLDLLNQVNWILTKREIENLEEIDPKEAWGKKKWELQRHARNHRRTYYFIIDGLTEIPEEDISYQDMILDLLPFESGDIFKFLISGDENKLSPKLKKALEKINYKTFPLPGLALEEANQLLADFELERDNIKRLYQINKMPGFFASIRRILSSGLTIEEIMDDLPKNCPEAFEFEWKKVDTSNKDLLNLLAVLAFSRVDLTVQEIAEIVGIESDKIVDMVSSLGFLVLSEDASRINYVNDHFRKFASAQLSRIKDTVESKIIEFLSNKPEDPRALTSLPLLYSQTGKYNELLVFLPPSNLVKVLDASQSLIQLSEVAKHGALAAQKLNKDGDFVGYALNTSVFLQMLQSDVLESEINALIALRDVQSAIALVERAPSREERFFLLSVLANAKQRHQLDIPGIEDQIKGLYAHIDVAKLGDRAIDIAANLIHVLPNLAFEIVEKAADSEDDENALDIAFLKLTLKASKTQGETFSSSDLMDKIQNRIKDPELRRFCNSNITFLDYSASQIIYEAEKAERASEKLFILRPWVLNNRESQDAAEVVEYALKVAISTTEYAPNARDYRELATPLPYIKDAEKLRTLIKIFDGQKGTVERFGPIEDYVRLLLTLAAAEKKIDFNACQTRLEEAYLYISDIKNLETKSICLARLVSALQFIDPDKKFEESDGFHSLVETDLDNAVNKLLSESADHYIVTRGIIRALAKNRPEKALEIANSLNGVERRNQAILDLITFYLDVPDERLNLLFVKRCFDHLTNPGHKDRAYLEMISRLSDLDAFESEENKKIARFLLENISQIKNPAIRCNACTLALSSLKLFEEHQDSYQNRILELLDASWNQIETQWEKINIGFKIVEALKDTPHLAYKFLGNVTNSHQTGKLTADSTAKAYLLSVYLALKAFSGLLPENLDTRDDLDRVLQTISAVTSRLHRIALYSELALRFKINEKEDKFSEIVRARIKPEIQNIPSENDQERWSAIYVAAPALYLFHSSSALIELDKLPDDYRDGALSRIANFILFRRLDYEPYNEIKPTLWPKLTYEDVVDVITLLEKIDQDAMIFSLIHEIAEGVNKDRNKFTRQQRSEIARRIEQIILQKFPNPKYITHEGFTLVSQAQVLRIKPSAPTSDWLNLLERARKIENTADRVFILAYIAESLPNKELKRKEEILEEAFRQIESIPSVHDQIGRCEVLASIAAEFSPALAKKYIHFGYQVGYASKEVDATDQLRELIDFAYKIDPELAASLASLADDDPARQEARRLMIQRRLEAAKLKDKILKSEISNDEITKQDDDLYIQAAWQLLGSLNAGKIAPIRFERARDYALKGLRLPIIQSYPIFAWLIQNGVSFYQKTPHAREYIRPLFEAAITSCNLILQISEKLSISKEKSLFVSLKDETEKFSRVLEGSSTYEAREMIIRWLKEKLSDYLIIADGYFGIEDLWILHEINAINPNCRVYILTSKEHNEQYRQPWQEEYMTHWRLHISQQEPPPTEVVVVGLKSSGKSPIHDRWWVTKNSGLRIGTSLHSIGETRISEITELSRPEASEREAQIRRFVIDKEPMYNGEKILYNSFTL
jgi:hypothetical protein